MSVEIPDAGTWVSASGDAPAMVEEVRSDYGVVRLSTGDWAAIAVCEQVPSPPLKDEGGLTAEALIARPCWSCGAHSREWFAANPEQAPQAAATPLGDCSQPDHTMSFFTLEATLFEHTCAGRPNVLDCAACKAAGHYEKAAFLYALKPGARLRVNWSTSKRHGQACEFVRETYRSVFGPNHVHEWHGVVRFANGEEMAMGPCLEPDDITESMGPDLARLMPEHLPAHWEDLTRERDELRSKVSELDVRAQEHADTDGLWQSRMERTERELRSTLTATEAKLAGSEAESKRRRYGLDKVEEQLAARDAEIYRLRERLSAWSTLDRVCGIYGCDMPRGNPKAPADAAPAVVRVLCPECGRGEQLDHVRGCMRRDMPIGLVPVPTVGPDVITDDGIESAITALRIRRAEELAGTDRVIPADSATEATGGRDGE
ncbi:MAG TPA: hypothetical protein VK571_06390 [Gemmatimonadaceae bacterium]|nr:hypothetical protein [Gemmatimonadaceae bacterium]